MTVVEWVTTKNKSIMVADRPWNELWKVDDNVGWIDENDKEHRGRIVHVRYYAPIDEVPAELHIEVEFIIEENS